MSLSGYLAAANNMYTVAHMSHCCRDHLFVKCQVPHTVIRQDVPGWPLCKCQGACITFDINPLLDVVRLCRDMALVSQHDLNLQHVDRSPAAAREIAGAVGPTLLRPQQASTQAFDVLQALR